MATNKSQAKTKIPRVVFQFKISLKNQKPPIWRRVLVPGDYTFKDLYLVIQSVMGWSDCHMHKFGLKDPETGKSIEVGGVGDLGYNDYIWLPESTRIDLYFRAINDKATYQYDLGFPWHHNILLEKIIPSVSCIKYPQCIAGRRATPPEDEPPYEDEESSYEDEEQKYDPEAFDAKLIVFKNSRDFLERSQGVDLASIKNTSQTSQVSVLDTEKYAVQSTSSKVTVLVSGKNSSETTSKVILAPEEVDSGSRFTLRPEDGVAARQKIVNYFASQIAIEKENVTLPQKRQLTESETLNPVPKKVQVAQNSQDIVTNRLSVPELMQTRLIDNTESNSSNSCDQPSESNVTSSIQEDTEDCYGKFIASQMRDIKDLEDREDLRIEIQSMIKKYKFKKNNL